ncbi:MAG: anti-sigma factor [Saprospiraceae bacterium]
MKKINLLFTLVALFIITSCGDKDTTKNLNLNLNGLEDLGSAYVYEGWIIVDGAPVSTGIFTVDGDGKLSVSSFEMEEDVLKSATKFVLSIEPKVDSDPAPSDTKILVGDFNGSSANVSIGTVGDFADASGKYILATPTNGMPSNENSGIWFLDLSSGSPVAGLNLPTLPAGWKYEGWVVIDGKPVTTGKFTAVDATDEADPFSGDMPLGMVNNGGFFPGEDFLNNAPSGLSFPTDIAGGTAVISIEPSPDNSDGPFTLKPLVHEIPSSATDHTTYTMEQNLNFPSGIVNR